MSGLPLVVFCWLFGLLWLLEALFGGLRYPAPAMVIGLTALGIGLLQGYPVLQEIQETRARYPGRATTSPQPEAVETERAA